MKLVTVLFHPLVGWAISAFIMAGGLMNTNFNTAMIVHVIVTPIFFIAISFFYFRRFQYTGPLQTALVFLGVVVALDFLVVALFVHQSLEMFSSPLSTWIPYALIFASTYLTGVFVISRRRNRMTPGNRWPI